ncbi:MAG TPA: hypothetical protein DDW30_07335 [Clostridiales bacterium]|nr:hypothetical protein [Clostridiales bacterium]
MKKLQIFTLVLCMTLTLFAFVNSYRMTPLIQVSPDYAVQRFHEKTGKPILSELPPEEQHAYLIEAGVDMSGQFTWENSQDLILDTIQWTESDPIITGLTYNNPGTVTFCTEVRNAVNRYYGREQYLSALSKDALVRVLTEYGVEFPKEDTDEYATCALATVLFTEMYGTFYPMRNSQMNDFEKQVYAAATAYYKNRPTATEALRYFRQKVKAHSYIYS